MKFLHQTDASAYNQMKCKCYFIIYKDCFNQQFKNVKMKLSQLNTIRYSFCLGISLLSSTNTHAQLTTEKNDTVCSGQLGVHYQVAPIANASSYSWTIPNGANITSGNTTNAIIVDFGTNAQSGSFSVRGINNCGAGLPSTNYFVHIINCNIDLSILKTVNHSSPLIGQDIVFSIVAINAGAVDVSGVRVEDLITDGYTYISATASKGTYDINSGVWYIDSLLARSRAHLYIKVRVNAEGNYRNTATIKGDATESDLSNNIAWVETTPLDFFIPEGFSPNADGINDLLVIRGIQFYPHNRIIIYNRWGNRVYEAAPYVNAWDGTNQYGISVGPRLLPTGTYFYILDLGNSTPVYKGWIYLNK